jgi:hypothetical protein
MDFVIETRLFLEGEGALFTGEPSQTTVAFAISAKRPDRKSEL